VRHRSHGKMHKSVDVQKLQEARRLLGVCCQKVSEAEVFVRGGIKDVLVSNQVRDPAKIDRLARLPKLGAASSSASTTSPTSPTCRLPPAARHHLECLVEIDCGAGRCGVKTDGPRSWQIAKAIDAAPGLKFTGIQAYQGAMQHIDSL
jgi:3-hydroxy-D-aspartate aldolase